MWLSSMDENEPAHLQKYFLCRLPSKRVRTVKEAYESLRPKIVREYWPNVKRQGDVFLIPTNVETRELPRPSLKRAVVWPESTHTASEVRRVGKKNYVRGTIRHEPTPWWRRPEHHRLTIGTQWHLAVPNRALESYSAKGSVD
jgi:hypothetical protein